MKRIFLIVFFAISTLVIFSQVVPTKTLRIANANTAFGSNISVGDHIFDIATKTLYVSETGIASSGMISNNMLNLTKVDTQVSIVSIAANGIENMAISPDWAYDHSVLNSAHGITEAKYNQDDVSSSDVTNALGFTPYNATNPSSYITDGNTGWDNSYGFITNPDEDDNIGVLLNNTAVDWTVNQIDFQSPFTVVVDESYEVDVGFNYTWAATAIETGYKTATFTHDLNEGHIGAYRINTTSPITFNITNLSTGDNGTIFLEMTAAPSTLIIAGYTGSIGVGATTEIVLGNTVTPTTGKHMSITYTYIGNGTSIFLYLVYGMEK